MIISDIFAYVADFSYLCICTTEIFESLGRDLRIGRRVAGLFNKMVEKQSAVINRCFELHTDKIGAYRILHNKRWDMEELTDRIRQYSGKACSVHGHVLCIQDTTELSYDHIRGRLSDDDPDFGDGTSSLMKYSVFVHPTLLVDAPSCLPIGFSSLRIWNRERIEGRKKGNRRSALPYKDKESCRWALAARESVACIPDDVRKTVVGDRENDVYAFMEDALEAGCDFLIRSSHDRMADAAGGPGRLTELLGKSGPVGEYSFSLPGRKGRKSRTAVMEVRFLPVSLHAPGEGAGGRERLDVCCVHVIERADSVPAGEEPVEWRLLTSHEVASLAQAVQCIEWYKCRWLVEELFRVAKSKGFGIEEVQLEDGESTKKLIALTFLAALKCLTLKRAYDTKREDVPAGVIFTEVQITVLHVLMKMIHAQSPKAKDGRNPFKQGSLPWAAWVIARLQGWCDMGKDTRPGYITLKSGLQIFGHQVAFYTNLKDVYKE